MLTTLLCLACPLFWSAEPGVCRAPLHGQVLDFTDNHGSDCRIYSRSLQMKRDLYVYLPPGYDPERSYPLMLWLHGFGGDEKQFLDQVVAALDDAIYRGDMPPIVAACPDGSLRTCAARPWHIGSWFINSKKGRWEDFVICDVLPFLHERFSLLPQREAHVIAGWSMGGFASYNLGLKYPEKFRILVGVYPNLNLRYAGKDGRWDCKYDAETETKLQDLKWYYKLGNYPGTRVPIVAGIVFFPVWGKGEKAIHRMSIENPWEMLDRFDVRPGLYDMFVAYGDKDEYHINEQVESFLTHAASRDLPVWVRRNPDGRHRWDYVNECLPDVFCAVGARLREVVPEYALETVLGEGESEIPSTELKSEIRSTKAETNSAVR